MENDLSAMRECATALKTCGRNVTGHMDDNCDTLTVTGNSGFVTVPAVSTIATDWTSQVNGFGRRLGSVGSVIAIAADDLGEQDTGNGVLLDQVTLPHQIV